MPFAKLKLIESLLRAVHSEGYTIPTAIQEQAIPRVLEGKDLLGCAQTGTGKTAAFALPILQLLSRHAAAPKPGAGTAGSGTAGSHTAASHTAGPGIAGSHTTGSHAVGAHTAGSHTAGSHTTASHAAGSRTARSGASDSGAGPHRTIRAMVLTPTRELAAQIDESFGVYGQHTGLRHTVVFGGVSQGPQETALRRGVDILVATPGRLLDLLQQKLLNLRSVEIFVLDEADRMLDMGFIKDVRRIIAQMPARRQTLMFSATMPPAIQGLADAILKDPVEVRIPSESVEADTVQQVVYFIDTHSKIVLLEHLLQGGEITRALVFTRTKHGADRVAERLSRSGIEAEAMHSNKSQNARLRALENFKRGTTRVLVASDIAARGLDVDDISHVINYDMPNEPGTYIHRIGRTGRAGAIGQAISFCSPEQRQDLAAIERLLGKRIQLLPHPIKSIPRSSDGAAPAPRHYGGRRPGYGSPRGGAPSHGRPAHPTHPEHSPHPSHPSAAHPRSHEGAPGQPKTESPERSQDRFWLHKRTSSRRGPGRSHSPRRRG